MSGARIGVGKDGGSRVCFIPRWGFNHGERSEKGVTLWDALVVCIYGDKDGWIGIRCS